MKRAFAVALLLSAISCRSTRPAGVAVPPLTATTSEEATAQLRERRESFRGLRSLIGVRASTNGKTQSFNGQLVIHDPRRMELIAYTPLGTRAMTMKADGDAVTTDPAVAPGSFDFLSATGLTPAETAMLLAGLPPRDGMELEVAPAGLLSASSGDIHVVFEPPSFPAKRVVITRGADRIEIEHKEVVQ
jgi:hypothetical protein